MYTGVPVISIPLYEIKVGELEVPISIQYHASGIKISDIPSYVGSGWGLSAGGNITRKMMGKPDEQDGNYLSGPTVKITTEIDPSVQSGIDYLRNIHMGNSDVEPDIFSYSFPGKNGTFLFNQRDNFKIITLPYDPIIVSRTHPTQSTMLLDVTDERGVQYKFDTYEWTNTSSGSSNTSAISSWMLSKMISSNKQDTIAFTYTERTGSGNTDHYFSEYIVLNDAVANFVSPAPYSSDNGSGSGYTSETWITTWWQKQNEILFKNGKIVFEPAADTREDFGIYGPVMANRLNAIKIYNYDKPSNSYKLIRTIQFYHSYFISGADATTKRLRLDSLSIMSSTGMEVEKYRFGYNTSQILPGRLSKAKDYWGYFNNVNNNLLIPRMEVVFDPGNGSQPNNIWIGSNILNGREPDPTYMQANMLTKIFYPTGGHTEFEYETNKYIDAQSNVKNAGGLRIKKIKNYDGITTNPIVKTYKYGDNESGNGRANFILNNYFFQNSQSNRYFQSTGGACDAVYANKRVRTFLSNPTIDIEPYDGSPVGYPIVTEYIGDETNNLGKTIYQFNDHGDGMNVVAGYGKPIITSYHFNRGQILAKTVYKKNSLGQFRKIAATTNLYEAFPEQFHAYLGLVVFKWRISQSSTSDNINFDAINPPTCANYEDTYSYLYSNYSIRTADNRLKETADLLYDENDETKYVETKTKYHYENFNHMQVTKIETTNSKGTTILNTKKYPHEYPGILPYTSMVSKNIINKVVEDKKTINGIQTNLQKNNYFDWTNNNYLPQTIQLQVGSNTIETRANFLKYDFRGNIQEMEKTNDIKLSYIWGYNSSYPIASVTNAGVNDIFYTSFEEGGWDGNLTAYDNAKANAGRYAGRIDKPTVGEQYSHSTKWLNISLANPTKFKYSGWVYSNGPGAEIFLFMKRAGETAYFTHVHSVSTNVTNKWVYIEGEYTVPADITQLNIRVDNNGGGTVWFDDIRLHPSAAMMTTYTYEPLVGMTSQCDVNNRITYYEYDGFGRLNLIRDQDKNILKKICYNYQGQEEKCNSYGNAAINNYYNSQNCSGQTPVPYYVSVPQDMFVSTASQADADQQAQQYAQNQANQYGTCQTPNIPINYSNNTNSGYAIELYNSGTGQSYWFEAYSNSSSTLGYVPQGTYEVHISPYDYDTYHSYYAGCGHYSSGNYGVSFFGVALDYGCNTIEMY